MKKLFLLLVVMIIGISGIAFGQVTEQLSATADLNLTGVVPQYVNITINTFAAASNIDLSSAQTTQLDVAEVTETANTAYTVSATSANGFALQSVDDVAYNVGYTLYYAGVAVTASGDIVTTGGISDSGTIKTVSITHNAANTTDLAGNYADTVTFDISAN